MMTSSFSWSSGTIISPATLMEQLTAFWDQCDSTSAWVFWPATCIFEDRAHWVRESAARCAQSCATSMVLPERNTAVSSA